MDLNYNPHPFSLTFELKIIKARNIHPKHTHQGLFVRCYLPVGTRNDKRARLESQMAIPSSKSNSPTWNQTFSLHCSGTLQDSIKCLKQGTVVFELRYRTNHCVLPFIASKLLGRAEVPLKDVFESPGMDIENNWVVMIPKNRSVVYGDVKPPAVQMTMKVIKEEHKVVSFELDERKEKVCERSLDHHCGCNSCVAYEYFALEACVGDF